MTKQIVKICGIRDAEIAQAAVQAGADFIGLVFHPTSDRVVTLTQAIDIAEHTRAAGGVPVAVFVDASAYHMTRICSATNITTVQLQGDRARAEHALLPNHYQRLFVHPVTPSGMLVTQVDLTGLEIERDFILLDHPTPGQGKQLNWARERPAFQLRWLLAGGLTAANVGLAQQLMQPHGVDVSSGVETSRGVKDITLIKQFITAARV